TQRIFGEWMFFHPSLHDRFANSDSALHPDPIHGAREETPRWRLPFADLPGKVEEAHRTGRNAVEINLGSQLEDARLQHPSIEPRKTARRCGDSVPTLCRRSDVRDQGDSLDGLREAAVGRDED